MIRFKSGKTTAVRLPHWTHCVLEVKDIGTVSLWGDVVDVKTNRVVASDLAFPLDEEWQIVMEAEDVLNERR